MKVLVVDNETNAREALMQIGALCCPQIHAYREANSVLTAIKAIQEEKPDIVFLDIDLGDDNGFSVIKHFEKEDLNVIFVTGYNEYVLKALRASAVDYLLKPLKASELIVAVQKVEQKILNQENSNFKTILANVEQDQIQKITIKTADSIYVINIVDVIYCESDKGYTTFYLKDHQKIIASKILRECEALLPKEHFMRVHQSFLVNLDHVIRYDKKDKNFLVTIEGHEIPVSHRLKSKVIDYFNALG